MSSRPPISWSDLRSATVGVWGLGVEGRASLRRLQALGTTVVLVDDDPPAAEVSGIPVLATAAGGLGELARCDVVVKAPGISRYRPEVETLEARVPVAGGLGLWMEGADLSRVACITGTKGKSTTTTLAGHLIRGLGRDCLVGGNIGVPPWDPAVEGPHDYVVVETSSFQATDLASSPPVVAVTSLHPDHLDWHGGVERYFADKLSACTQPGAKLTVADGHSDLLRDRSALLGSRVRWVGGGEPPRWLDDTGLRGAHNARNARIAVEVFRVLGVPGADDEDALADAARGFDGLQSRLQTLGTVEGVDFVDDSLSTNALSSVAALEAFGGRRVALLVGGHDRGIDYRRLAEAVAGRDDPTLVVTMPDNGPRIGAAVVVAARSAGRSGRPVEVLDRDDLATATRDAWDWAGPGGVVLLSPAAPSFGTFRNFGERSAAFGAAMAACGQPAGHRARSAADRPPDRHAQGETPQDG